VKEKIDIFDGDPNFRWDLRQNAELLNIVFGPATFGHFFKYFIERFSKKTPPMEQEPFNDIGTSHSISKEQFSGMVQRYHASFINDNAGSKGLPVCLIMPTRRKHFLYLKKAQWFRDSNKKISPDHLWQKPLNELPSDLRAPINNMTKLYGIADREGVKIPKFIVRDFFKLEFLEPLDETLSYRWFAELRKHPFFSSQKTFEFDLEAFFDWECFINSLRDLDTFFDLGIDFGRQSEMKELLEKGLSLDEIRSECNKVEDVLTNGADHNLEGLDVTAEAYIYAETEKKNDFIQMPLTNNFFRDTAELKEFIEHYPNHYKAMNPNMPKFNGIANPYYLKKGK